MWGGMRGEGGVCYWGAQGSLAMPLLRGGEGRRGLPYQPSPLTVYTPIGGGGMIVQMQRCTLAETYRCGDMWEREEGAAALDVV